MEAPSQSVAAGAGAGGKPAKEIVHLIRAASESKPQRIAGAIAHNVRAGASPTVTALGAASLNQAVKACAIARGYLEGDGLDFTCRPGDRKDIGRDGVELSLQRLTTRQAPLPTEDVLLRVAAQSDAGALAGAIAGKVRLGQKVAALAIGADAVKQVVKGVCFARRYLAAEGFELAIVPLFVQVTMDAGRRNAIKVAIMAQHDGVTPIGGPAVETPVVEAVATPAVPEPAAPTPAAAAAVEVA